MKIGAISEQATSAGPNIWSHGAGIPLPVPDERPTVYADRVGEWYVASKPEEYRKKHGLYLTSVPVADFMARRIGALEPVVRVLDPAAGGGILCCSAVEALASRDRKPRVIQLTAYEVDAELTKPLERVLSYLASWCLSKHGMRLEARVRNVDFVVAHSEALKLMHGLIPYDSDDRDFDVVISNPPYFKIARTDPRAVAALTVVHGQPNIYALFMAVGAALLKPGGDFIFITPRSFTSGPYFKRFRSVLFGVIRPKEVHVFGSRRDAFRRDEVLQENIIFSGVRQDHWNGDGTRKFLKVSSSHGVAGIGEPDCEAVPMSVAFLPEDGEKVLRLPLSERDMRIIEIVDAWPNTLRGLGLNISTGPVIPFRAEELVDGEGTVPETHAPLIWMNHVRAMRVQWPLNGRKPEYIKRDGSRTLLVPNANYVLVRRFSAKEEASRLAAAPYMARDFAVPAVGLENHLNYVYRPGETLSEDETWGLAALYNSGVLNTYFRCLSGNTQVSATELRAMPLPSYDTVVALGRKVRRLDDPTRGLDELVMDTISARMDGEVVVGER